VGIIWRHRWAKAHGTACSVLSRTTRGPSASTPLLARSHAAVTPPSLLPCCHIRRRVSPKAPKPHILSFPGLKGPSILHRTPRCMIACQVAYQPYLPTWRDFHTAFGSTGTIPHQPFSRRALAFMSWLQVVRSTRIWSLAPSWTGADGCSTSLSSLKRQS
jgi:hypothetical protein